jgi:hypothetical protein
MQVTWSQLAFLPSDAALGELLEAWSWLLPEQFEPVTASTLGDVFFQQGGEAVYWLNTGTAEISRVAESRSAFLDLLKTEKADEWFMPSLIQDLLNSGKCLQPGYCYTYVVLPIFKEGKYEVSNLNAAPAGEHFGLTGALHRKICDLPDGAQVQVKWE